MQHPVGIQKFLTTFEKSVILNSRNDLFDVCPKFGCFKMNMFWFVQCSKTDVQVSSMFDKMVFDPSLGRPPFVQAKLSLQGLP